MRKKKPRVIIYRNTALGFGYRIYRSTDMGYEEIGSGVTLGDTKESAKSTLKRLQKKIAKYEIDINKITKKDIRCDT